MSFLFSRYVLTMRLPCPCILDSVLGASRKHSRVNLGITSFWKLFSFQMWRAPLSTFVHLWTFVVLSNSHFVLPIPPLTTFISSPRAVLQSTAKFKSDGRQQATAHYAFVFVFVNVSYFVFVFSKLMMESNYSHSLFFTEVWKCERIYFCSALIWVISSLMPQGFIILETYFWHFYWSLVQFVVTGVRAWGPRAFWSEFHFSRLCAHRLSTLW